MKTIHNELKLQQQSGHISLSRLTIEIDFLCGTLPENMLLAKTIATELDAIPTLPIALTDVTFDCLIGNAKIVYFVDAGVSNDQLNEITEELAKIEERLTAKDGCRSRHEQSLWEEKQLFGQLFVEA